MKGRRAIQVALDAGTGLAVVAALALVTRDRLVPAWQERAFVDEGERLPAEVALRRLDGSDTLRTEDVGPAALFLLRSTCAACEGAIPAWTRLIEELPPGTEAIAVALEPDADGLRYIRERLPGAVATRPTREGPFAEILRVRVVPTTLFVDAGGRLRFRRAGPPEPADADSILRLASGAGRDRAAQPRGSP